MEECPTIQELSPLLYTKQNALNNVTYDDRLVVSCGS
jgi:hypothetical protein